MNNEVAQSHCSNQQAIEALLKLSIKLSDKVYKAIEELGGDRACAHSLQEVLWFLDAAIKGQDGTRDDAIGNVIALEAVMPCMNMVLQGDIQVCEFSSQDKMALAAIISQAAQNMQKELANEIVEAA